MITNYKSKYSICKHVVYILLTKMLRAWTIKVVLFLHDLYCDLRVRVLRVWLWFVCKVYAYAWNNLTSTRVLYAGVSIDCASDPIITPIPSHISPVYFDVTPLVQGYYAYDKVLSCWSLQKWMKRFGIVGIVCLIYIHDGVLRKCVLDLDDDKELLTNIESADIELDKLPYKELFSA